MQLQALMYYYVNRSGDVVLGVNGKDKGVFFSGVDTRRMLWGMVDVYGNSNVIQLVDPRTTLNNIRKDVQEAKVAENKLSELISCEQLSKISENQQIYAVKKCLVNHQQQTPVT